MLERRFWSSSKAQLRSLALTADRFLAGFLDPREILRVRTAILYGEGDAIAEAVCQDGVVDDSVPALSLGAREVLVGGHPVTQLGSDLFEIARASKLLGAETFGHPACEFRDVTLLSCLDEDSLHAELLQFGRNGSAAFRIPLNPRHAPTLGALSPPSAASSDIVPPSRESGRIDYG